MSDIHITSMEMHWTPNQLNQPIIEEFLHSIDLNSQPNGRAADTSGPTHYFLPLFTTIQPPKPGVVHYEFQQEFGVKKRKRWQAKAKEVRIGSLLEHRYAWCLKKYRFEYSFDLEANIKNHYNYFLSALESRFK